jgi:tripeptide aminopeptidase
MKDLLENLEDRFLRYVQIDTQSNAFSETLPSTAKQYDLLNLLADELRQMGAADVCLTDYACVMATMPATVDDDSLPTVAFLAHVDTSPDFSGANVKPIFHRNYDGNPIVLPDNPRQVLTVDNSPELKGKIGEDIVTASGTTLLGADDKAGVAIVMALAEWLLQDSSIPHGPVRVCFTPDEEIGTGVRALDLDNLGADVAYTLDASDVGEIIYETFSADKAVITISGVSTHPGFAYGKMVNAIQLAGKILAALPQEKMTPATTRGREGFIHAGEIHGNNVQVELRLILRDFEREGLAEKGSLVQRICREVGDLEPRASITCDITAQYRNMRYWLEDDMRPVELAREAIRRVGLEPLSPPIRGGTDGSQLTERGLPTPNLFCGMHNFHGPLEWVSLQDMALAVRTCRQLVELWADAR